MSNVSLQQNKLFAQFGAKYGVDQSEVSRILKATAFKLPAKKNEPPQTVTDEQMTALLVVANAYGLNPFTKEIYAFPDKSGGITPIVGVDGWTHICNSHPEYDGIEFNYSEKMVELEHANAPCPEYIEAVIYHKKRSRPVIIREYAEECYVKPYKGQYGVVNGPWQTHTRRQLRHKAMMQCARIAFGFSGIYDEDEGRAIVDITPYEENNTFNIPAQTTPAIEQISTHERFSLLAKKTNLGTEKVESYMQAWEIHAKQEREQLEKVALSNENEFLKTIEAYYNNPENTSTRTSESSDESPSKKAELTELRKKALNMFEISGIPNPHSCDPERWNTSQCNRVIELAEKALLEMEVEAAKAE